MNNAEVELIQPMPVELDADGYWSHPGMPDLEEDSTDAFTVWMTAQGLEYQIDQLEYEDESNPAFIRYFDDGEGGPGPDWDPEKPEGDGWFTLSIHDTEDGPVWVWVRRATTAKEPS